MGLPTCAELLVTLPVAVTVALFGIGSWIAINGLWVELPLLVQELPEGWDLPSYLTVIIQIANIGPIIYTLLSIFLPKNKKRIEQIAGYFIILAGTVSTLFLAFYWDHTSMIGGVNHSTSLLTFALILALVDCTSSVVFLPFMAVFKQQYMTPFYIGEGLSGLLPSVVALGQGAGEYDCLNTSSVNKTTNETTWSIQPHLKTPAFPVEDFFFFLCAMMVVCGLAFTALNFLQYCKREYAPEKNYLESQNQTPESGSDTSLELSHEGICPSQTHSEQSTVASSHPRNPSSSKANLLGSTADRVSTLKNDENAPISNLVYVVMLVVTAWVNGLGNGVFPSIQTYSCLPYGQTTYNLAVKLSNLANPLACFMAFFLPVKSHKVIGGLVGVGTLIGGYIMVTAAMSPLPPLVDQTFGSVLVVRICVEY